MQPSRYHVEVYVPEWAREQIISFSKKVAGKKLAYSVHATNKLRRMDRRTRAFVKKLISTLDISNEQLLDYVFEFYSGKDNNIKKVCYRFPTAELPYDIVLVISSKATIVTIYTNDLLDKHKTLDKSIYQTANPIISIANQTIE